MYVTEKDDDLMPNFFFNSSHALFAKGKTAKRYRLKPGKTER